VQLTDDAGTGSADTDKVDEARLGAEGEVNSYLAQRYAVPIDLTEHSELVGLLASVTLDLIEFRLHCRRPPVPRDITGKRDAALGWLRQVADGAVTLPTTAEVAGNEARGLTARALGRPRVFTDEELESL
jgi:phage gp36-like protein